jgi:lipoate-protein ligase B
VEGDLGPFRRFAPCGLDGEVMTSMEACGVPISERGRVSSLLVDHLSAVLE